MNTDHPPLIDGERLRFVLSTGRTGTTQLREFLRKNQAHLGIAFEPPPSRPAYILWNAECAGYPFRGMALKLLLRSKHKMLAMNSGCTVEFDSYLSPLICVMLDHVDKAHVVHMVRHPYTWIESIGNFKAASWRKHVVGHAPFTEIIHPHIRDQWRSLDRHEQLAWSWRHVNEQIIQRRGQCRQYVRVKFEDFVCDSAGTRKTTINSMLEILDPEHANPDYDIDVHEKLNRSETRHIEPWQNWPERLLHSVNRICEPLMNEFGYDIHRP